MRIRQQLAAYSPVSAHASLRALRGIVPLGEDPREKLRDLHVREFDAAMVLLCGSGTQALTFALREAMKHVEAGSSVALPAFSCFDLATAAVGADVRVSGYDLDPDTLGPDLSSLERALNDGARVVVVAPLYGMPVDWEDLRGLTDRHGAILIEDAAQGNGAKWKGRPLGTLGEVSILSFGRGKGWTGGNGGALLMRGSSPLKGGELHDAGFSRDAMTAFLLFAHWAMARPPLYGIPASIPKLQLGQTIYREPTTESTITRAAAQALLETRQASQREAEIRRRTAGHLLRVIGENPNVHSIAPHRAGTAGYLRLPIRLARGIASFGSGSEPLALGIAPSYPRSLMELPQLAGRLSGPARRWPGAQTLVRELVTLPTHSRLGASGLQKITEICGTL